MRNKVCKWCKKGVPAPFGYHTVADTPIEPFAAASISHYMCPNRSKPIRIEPLKQFIQSRGFGKLDQHEAAIEELRDKMDEVIEFINSKLI